MLVPLPNQASAKINLFIRKRENMNIWVADFVYHYNVDFIIKKFVNSTISLLKIQLKLNANWASAKNKIMTVLKPYTLCCFL